MKSVWVLIRRLVRQMLKEAAAGEEEDLPMLLLVWELLVSTWTVGVAAEHAVKEAAAEGLSLQPSCSFEGCLVLVVLPDSVPPELHFRMHLSLQGRDRT